MPSDASDDLLYEGETRARRPRVARALALIAPGMAFFYLGRMTRGVTINLLFVLWIEAFLILWMALRFFPLGPGLVFATGGLLGALWVGARAARAIEDQGLDQHYVLRPMNHWLVYLALAGASFYLPVYMSFKFVASEMVTLHAVEGAGMMPTLWHGDLLLIDRRLQESDLVPGALLSFELNTDARRTMRLVAMPGDQVRIESGLILRNDELLGRSALEPKLQMRHGAQALQTYQDQLSWMTEQNGPVAYPIAVARGGVDQHRGRPDHRRAGALLHAA